MLLIESFTPTLTKSEFTERLEEIDQAEAEEPMHAQWRSVEVNNT